MSMTSISKKRLTPAIGLEIRGIDLGEKLSADTADEIYRLLIEGQVIFLPQQNIAAADLLQFAANFGDLDEPHHVYPHVDELPQVMLLEQGGDSTTAKQDTDVWHTDLTYKTNPPFASVLHSQVIPEVGGDTLWASMSAAYKALPEHMKAMLEGVRAVHDMGSFRNQYYSEGGESLVNEKMASLGQAVHDIVKVHPVSGEKYLFINRGFTFHVLDYSTGDSQRLLEYLLNHIEQPEFQVRHRWEPNTVAMWDNRITQHYAVYDYLPAYRRMHRVTVLNDQRAGS